MFLLLSQFYIFHYFFTSIWTMIARSNVWTRTSQLTWKFRTRHAAGASVIKHNYYHHHFINRAKFPVVPHSSSSFIHSLKVHWGDTRSLSLLVYNLPFMIRLSWPTVDLIDYWKQTKQNSCKCYKVKCHRIDYYYSGLPMWRNGPPSGAKLKSTNEINTREPKNFRPKLRHNDPRRNFTRCLTWRSRPLVRPTRPLQLNESQTINPLKASGRPESLIIIVNEAARWSLAP